MRNIFLLFIAVMLLSGCSTVVWVNPNKSQEEFYQEKLTCEEMSNSLAWQRYPQSTGPTINNTIYAGDVNDKSQERSSSHNNKNEDPYEYHRSQYHDEIFRDCLKSKGWVPQVVEKR